MGIFALCPFPPPHPAKPPIYLFLPRGPPRFFQVLLSTLSDNFPTPNRSHTCQKKTPLPPDPSFISQPFLPLSTVPYYFLLSSPLFPLPPTTPPFYRCGESNTLPAMS